MCFHFRFNGPGLAAFYYVYPLILMGVLLLILRPLFSNVFGALKKGWLYIALLVDLGHQGASARRFVSNPSSNWNLLLILDLYENCNFITNVSLICSSVYNVKVFWSGGHTYVG